MEYLRRKEALSDCQDRLWDDVLNGNELLLDKSSSTILERFNQTKQVEVADIPK